MVTPKRIKVHNFVTIKDVDLRLDRGTYFITGENRDEIEQESNGAGKSLLCETIPWVLFEDLLRKGMLRDDIIGKHDEYTQVTIWFDVDGETFIVDRVRNHPDRGNDVKVYADEISDDNDMSKHKKSDTTKFICNKLGINPKIMYYCAYAGKKQDPLVGLTSTELNTVVSEILNTQRYDQWISKVRKQGRELETEMNTSMKLLNSKEEQVEEVEDDCDMLTEDLRTFQERLDSQIEEIEEEIESVESERDEFRELIEGKDKVQDEFDEIEYEVRGIEILNSRLKAAQRNVKSRTKKVQKFKNRMVKLKANIKGAESAYNNLAKNPSGECDYCGNTLQKSADLARRIKVAKKRLDKSQGDKIDLSVNIDNSRNALKVEEDKVDELTEEIEGKRDKLDRYHKLEKKLESYKRAEKFITKCEAKLEKLTTKLEGIESQTPDAKRKALKKKEARLAELVAERSELRTRVEGCELDIKASEELETALKATKAARFNSFMLSLQDKINENLDILTEGDYHCKLEADKGELGLRFIGGTKDKYLSYHAYSTGEQARISKAASTALNEMMDLGVVIDDEGLNGVDDVGIERLLEFILEKNGDKLFFFVGHQKKVHDYFAGCNNLHIVKEDGDSKITLRKMEAA